MRRPYIAQLAEIDDIECWLVDGTFIRDQVDVDFTNGAHTLSRRYIPARQIWLDREAPGAGELQFLIGHLLVELRLMRAGVPYLHALARANRFERKLRRAQLAGPALTPAQARERVRKERVGMLGRDLVWIVDGRGVRDRFDPNFTQGGHGLRYRFIPRREIWIDDAVAERELDVTLGHEAHELALMREGMSYDDAHASALAFEKNLRSRIARMNVVYSKLQYGALLSKLCKLNLMSY
jgi:hypothetical protein